MSLSKEYKYKNFLKPVRLKQSPINKTKAVAE